MATFTVTTAADVVNAGDGALSLREAVAQANATAAPDAILFAPALEGRTLVLTGGELVLSHDVTDRRRPERRRPGSRSRRRRDSRILRSPAAGTDVASAT